MKKIVVILIIGLLAISFSGCNVKQTEQVSFLSEVGIDEKTAVLEVIITEEEKLPTLEPNPDKEQIPNVMEAKKPQPKEVKSQEPIIPQNLINDTDDTITADPITSTTPTVTARTSTQTQQPTQTSTPNPTPTPQPMPTPTPTPQPTPDPTPPPPPVIVEPPPARTICNICGADITDNVAAHGTEYLLKGENFSYRNE